MNTLALAEEADVIHKDALLAVARSLDDEADRIEQFAHGLRDQAAKIRAAVLGTKEIRIVRGREIIVALLQVTETGEPMHFREMTDRLAVAGYRPGGVDAASTLLASLLRAPEYFEQLGQGMYQRKPS